MQTREPCFDLFFSPPPSQGNIAQLDGPVGDTSDEEEDEEDEDNDEDDEDIDDKEEEENDDAAAREEVIHSLSILFMNYYNFKDSLMFRRLVILSYE